MRVVGVDPGPVPGIVVLTVQDGVLLGSELVQCTAGAAPDIVATFLHGWPARVAVEKFVVTRVSRTAGHAAGSPGAITRDLVGTLQEVVRSVARRAPDHLAPGPQLTERSAAQVKPWATDERLAAAGLLERTKGMRHARDAARHALYDAVRAGLLPDPLSKRWVA